MGGKTQKPMFSKRKLWTKTGISRGIRVGGGGGGFKPPKPYMSMDISWNYTHCAVPENIHTPPPKGLEFPEG